MKVVAGGGGESGPRPAGSALIRGIDPFREKRARATARAGRSRSRASPPTSNWATPKSAGKRTRSQRPVEARHLVETWRRALWLLHEERRAALRSRIISEAQRQCRLEARQAVGVLRRLAIGLPSGAGA
jgi:hypothetical protein